MRTVLLRVGVGLMAAIAGTGCAPTLTFTAQPRFLCQGVGVTKLTWETNGEATLASIPPMAGAGSVPGQGEWSVRLDRTTIFTLTASKGGKSVRGDQLVYPQIQWRITTKPGKAYFTFFDEPRAPFALPPVRNTITRAYRLADKAPVDLKMENGRAVLNIERPIFDPMATVIVVEFEGDALAPIR